ncbi:MAG: hypothetical protein AAGD11_12895 [Planctomycetota bacterium]
MPSTILPEQMTAPDTPFIERREAIPTRKVSGRERRQFANSHDHLSPEASELAKAIDQYKLQHRRRFINFEEMLTIMKSLGYHK